MQKSSENEFRIFVSSTCYDLVDLRAELARYLRELGYKPVLSDEQGFPDKSPALHPWESCLKALESCYVVVVVIDGKYGKKFSWPSFESLFCERKLSPTHAEFLHAKYKNKRIFVFIRKEVMTHYASYRKAMKSARGDSAKAREYLKKTLPNHIEFEALEFVHEVKTSEPIIWVLEFDDVTNIKEQLRMKMLNELADVFKTDIKHYALLIDRAMEEFSPEKREEILSEMGFARDLLRKDSEQQSQILALESELKEKGKKVQESKVKDSNHVQKLYGELNSLRNELAHKRSIRADEFISNTSVSSPLSGGTSMGLVGLHSEKPNCPSCGSESRGFRGKESGFCRMCGKPYCYHCNDGDGSTGLCWTCGQKI